MKGIGKNEWENVTNDAAIEATPYCSTLTSLSSFFF